MSVCPNCGAAIEPGQSRCAACASAQAGGPAPEAEDATGRIERKIPQARFTRNDVWTWGLRGGLTGLSLGLLVGGGIWIAHILSPDDATLGALPIFGTQAAILVVLA